MNLVLTGFMGTGKTTAGKRLALRLGLKFVDTDQEIERITGMTIKEIFKRHGERRFRSEEAAAILRISQADNQVIATGGGVVLDHDNIEALRQNGIIVCLTAEPGVIYNRVNNKKTRPLLEVNNPLSRINDLLEERKNFYANADYTLDTSDLTLDEVVDKLAGLYDKEVAKNG